MTEYIEACDGGYTFSKDKVSGDIELRIKSGRFCRGGALVYWGDEVVTEEEAHFREIDKLIREAVAEMRGD